MNLSSQQRQISKESYTLNTLQNYYFPSSLKRKLIQQNNWTSKFTDRVLKEYLRFVHLTMISDTEMTPSKIVDLAWHMHLTFTRDYWERMIPMLPRVLHHNPCEGKDPLADKIKYQDQYQKTLQLYSQEFGESPPDDIWGNTKPKKKEDIHKNYKATKITGSTTIKTIIILLILGLPIFLWNVFGEGAGLLGLILAVFLIIGVNSIFNNTGNHSNTQRNNNGSGGDFGDSDSGDSGGDGGGCGGCGGCGG